LSDDPLRDARRRESIRLACDIIGLTCIAGAGFLAWSIGMWGLWLIVAGLCFLGMSYRLNMR